jgi:hypothetical protein
VIACLPVPVLASNFKIEEARDHSSPALPSKGGSWYVVISGEETNKTSEACQPSQNDERSFMRSLSGRQTSVKATLDDSCSPPS